MTPDPAQGKAKRRCTGILYQIDQQVSLAQGERSFSSSSSQSLAAVTYTHPSLPGITAPVPPTHQPANPLASQPASPPTVLPVLRQRFIFPDFFGVSPSSLFWKAFPLCYRSYLPVCFLLAKRLALTICISPGPPRPK